MSNLDICKDKQLAHQEFDSCNAILKWLFQLVQMETLVGTALLFATAWMMKKYVTKWQELVSYQAVLICGKGQTAL